MRSTRARCVAPLFLVGLLACGPSAGPDAAPTTDDTGTDDGATGTSSPDDATSGTDESTGQAPVPLPPGCGNGVVEEGESCDDANDVDTDACNDDCHVPGEVLWQTAVDMRTHALDVAALPQGGAVVVGDHKLVRLDEDGQVLDTIPDPAGLASVVDRVTIADDGWMILASSLQGDVALLDPDGQLMWSEETGVAKGDSDFLEDGSIMMVGWRDDSQPQVVTYSREGQMIAIHDLAPPLVESGRLHGFGPSGGTGAIVGFAQDGTSYLQRLDAITGVVGEVFAEPSGLLRLDTHPNGPLAYAASDAGGPYLGALSDSGRPLWRGDSIADAWEFRSIEADAVHGVAALVLTLDDDDESGPKLVQRHDVGGALVWQTEFAGDDYPSGGLAFDRDGNVFAAGRQGSNDGDAEPVGAVFLLAR